MLSGNTLAQVVPAIVAPVLTRLYRPVDFGTFAFVLAVFGVLAPMTCLRYELAIMLPKDDERATQVTSLCLVMGLAIAAVSFVIPATAWLLMPNSRFGLYCPLLLAMLPAGIVMLGTQLIAQNWALRVHDYRVLSLAIIVQAFVTIGSQTLLGAVFGSSPYFLVMGTLAGYLALVIVYLPIIRGQILPRLRAYHSLHGAFDVARHFLRFPLYTGPYAFVAQAAVRGVFLVLAALTATAVVGQYALAQRVIFLPVVTLMAAASQIFFARAAQKLDDPRMPHMVRTLLVAGPLIVGPVFMMLFLFGERIFTAVFGREWQQAGRFAVILTLPSMAKSLTAWLDRIYDIQSRQRLALINETAYAVVALTATYVALRVTGNVEFGLQIYATVTVVYYVIWLFCSLAVAGFDLLIGGEFVITSASIVFIMIGCDRFFQWAGTATLTRSIGDLLMAVPLIAVGLKIAVRRMRGPDPELEPASS